MYPHQNANPPNLNFNSPPPPAAHQSAQPSYLNPQFAPPPKQPTQGTSGGGSLLKTLNIFSTKPSFAGPNSPALGPASPGGAGARMNHSSMPPWQQQQQQPQPQPQQYGQPIQQHQQQHYQQPQQPPPPQQPVYQQPYTPAPPAAQVPAAPPPPYQPNPPEQKPHAQPQQHQRYNSGGASGSGSPQQGHSPFVPTVNYNTRPNSSSSAAAAAVAVHNHTDWGGLLDYQSSPPGATLKLRGLLKAIVETLSRENTDQSPHGILSPAKMAVYYASSPAYAAFFRTASTARPRALATFYRQLGSEYVLVPTASDDVMLPGLTSAGFEKWMLHQLHLHPDVAHQVMSAYISPARTLKDPETGRTFPTSQPLPRSALPAHPDQSTAQRYASIWNSTVHAPPSTPDERSEAQRLREQLVEMQTQHSTHTSESQRLAREVETVRQQKDRELAMVKKGAAETSRDYQHAKGDVARLQGELDTARADVTALTADRDRAQAELATARATITTKEAEELKIRSELDAQTQALTLATAEVQRLNHQAREVDGPELLRLRSDAQRLSQAREAETQELHRLRSDVQRLNQARETDTQELHRLRSAMHGNNSLQSDLSRHRAESDRLQSQLAQLRESHNQALAAESRKVVTANADLISKSSELDALRAELRRKDSEVQRLSHQLKVGTVLPMTPPAETGAPRSPVVGVGGGGGGAGGAYAKPVYGRRTSNVTTGTASPGPAMDRRAGGGVVSPVGFEFERRGTGMSNVSSVSAMTSRGGAAGKGGAVLPYPENP